MNLPKPQDIEKMTYTFMGELFVCVSSNKKSKFHDMKYTFFGELIVSNDYNLPSCGIDNIF